MAMHLLTLIHFTNEDLWILHATDHLRVFQEARGTARVHLVLIIKWLNEVKNALPFKKHNTRYYYNKY